MATSPDLAAVDDLETAEAALRQAAEGYRESRQPLFECFVLVELAAVYHLGRRREELPRLAERARTLRAVEGLTPPQIAIIQLAVELIESAPEDPAGLEIFQSCWTCAVPKNAKEDR